LQSVLDRVLIRNQQSILVSPWTFLQFVRLFKFLGELARRKILANMR
jgi:hypothetical protein